MIASFLRKCIFFILSVGAIPNHIAFIMDGNRRYTKRWNLMEGSGYKIGFSALMFMLKYCYEFGVRYVTIYAFSIENFKRSPKEVKPLMDLMLEKIEELIKEESIVNPYGVRIYFSGNLKLLSEPVRLAAKRAMLATAKNSKAVLSICVAYTSTNEIVHAIQKSCEEKWDEINILNSSGAGYGLIRFGGNEQDERDHLINLTDIERHMYMAVAPDPDIIIRTSGAPEQFSFMAECELLFIFSFSALARDWSLSISVGHTRFSADSFLLGQEKKAVLKTSQMMIFMGSFLSSSVMELFCILASKVLLSCIRIDSNTQYAKEDADAL